MHIQQHAMLDAMPRAGAATAADIEILERRGVVRVGIVRKAGFDLPPARGL
jgi:hypothetical protein